MTLFPLTPDSTQNKTALLKYFRERGNERLAELRIEIGNINYKGLASRLNKAVVGSLDAVNEAILAKAGKEGWNLADRLRSLLTSTYCDQVAMLDLRNEVWQQFPVSCFVFDL